VDNTSKTNQLIIMLTVSKLPINEFFKAHYGKFSMNIRKIQLIL